MQSTPRKSGVSMNKTVGHEALLKVLKAFPFAATILISAPEPSGTLTATAVSSAVKITIAGSAVSTVGGVAPSLASPPTSSASGASPTTTSGVGAGEEQDMMDVVVTKIISLLVLAVLSVLSGLLPLRMLIHSPNIFSRGRGSLEYFLCGMRLFSGGIYLATCFLHLMPDTRDKMKAVMINMGSRTTYAVPELLVMSGFYAVVFVEQIIQALYVKAQECDAKRKKRRRGPNSNRDPHRRRPPPTTKASTPDDDSCSHFDIDTNSELDVIPNNTIHCSNRACGQREVEHNDDDEDDDEDDVLVDEEEDMSFDNSDSDVRSVDSMTEAKEKLIDPNSFRETIPGKIQKSSPHPVSFEHPLRQTIPPGPVHVHRKPAVSSIAVNRQNSRGSSSPNTDSMPLKTFCPDTLGETLPRRPLYPSGPPPTIHIHNHQHKAPRPSPEMNHYGPHPHFHHHPQHDYKDKQLKTSTPPSPPPPPPSESSPAKQPNHDISKHNCTRPCRVSISSSPPPPALPPHIPTSQHSVENPTDSDTNPLSPDSTSLNKQPSAQYPDIDKIAESKLTGNTTPDVESASSPSSRRCIASIRDGDSFHPVGMNCIRDSSNHRGSKETTFSTAAPFTYTPNATGANCTNNNIRPLRGYNSSSQEDKDVDSGIFSARRDTEAAHASEVCKFTPSREVSFDRISETSSHLHDIQVKRVVEELSRGDDSSRAHYRSIIYIMALSFHGIFEGMALGLQSMKSSVWALCFAIVVHRCVLAFKLGMDLCRGDEKHGTAFLCIGTFTLISTLGIIIGILICSGASLYADVTVPEAILQSLATGTIFYIVFFDILFKDLEGNNDLKRISCSFVGFALMAIVFAITRS